MVMPERCVGCGWCVRVCTQKAKQIESGIAETERILQSDRERYAILAPSFPAAFPHWKPLQLVTALRRLGFDRVLSAGAGADLISARYRQLIEQRTFTTLISSPCPAVVSYIEKHKPALLLFLAPIVSPMIATGRLIRETMQANAGIVFIGPCIAKKMEKSDRRVSGVIDEVLTFGELQDLLEKMGIQPAELPESEPDEPGDTLGGIFPISGGLLRTAALQDDVLSNEIVVCEGADRVGQVLAHVEEGHVDACFLDLLFCQGCIDGPAMPGTASVHLRKTLVADYVRRRVAQQSARPDQPHATIDLSRKFTREAITLPYPSEEEISQIFRQINKHKAEDELNCGACGYASCREKAIAVFQRRAELEMCLPYMIDRLEEMNRELLEAQERLIRSARLASMGEVAAGVAHEINNPLAGVINYIRLMRKKIQEVLSGATLAHVGRYLDIMETETRRISEIVQELLNFARPTEPDTCKIVVADLIKKSLFLLSHQFALQNIAISEEVDDADLSIRADFKQMQQVLLNVFINAAQAMPDGGSLTVRAGPGPQRTVDISIVDSGCGIPAEHLTKIFDPFFSTKLEKKGTGLGLSVVYSIITKHQGTILVDSQVGKGTTFLIRLPRCPVESNTH
jgi:signal transduction histidine kinase